MATGIHAPGFVLIQGISEQSPSSRKDLFCCDQVTWLLCSIVKVKPRSRLGGGRSGPWVFALSQAPGVQPSAPVTPGAQAQGRRACTLHPGGATVSCRAELSGVRVWGERGAEQSSLGAAGQLLPVPVSAVPEALPVRLQGGQYKCEYSTAEGEGCAQRLNWAVC